MNDPTETQQTLLGEISNLRSISNKLEVLVFGERPNVEKTERLMPPNQISYAIDQMADIRRKLIEVAEALEVIGK